MTVPALTHATENFPGDTANAAVVVAPDTEAFPEALDAFPGLSATLESIGFTGAAGSFARVHAPDVSAVPLAVVGAGVVPSAGSVRDAAGTAIRSLTGFDTVALTLAAGLDEYVAAAAEGAALGAYRFAGYQSETPPARATHVTIHAADLPADAIARAIAVAESVALVKDLVNVPAEWQSPSDLATSAQDAVAHLPVTVDVYDEKRLADEGFGGLIGVGQGSDRPPRLVKLDYAPANATRHIALVGKGITFDTGGLSLKPAASMMGMKFDMAGAATVLAVVRGMAALGSAVRVTGWMCITDNMPSGKAIRPGDVLRLLDGQTVEVTNTDAEGRLVLADGLVAASRENPDLIIDVATLTGAILVALGHRHTGVMGEAEAVAEYLSTADSVDELAWQLPLPEYMEETLDSPIADMLNANLADRSGGSMFAGLFLQRFIGRNGDGDDAPRIPWVHLDVAGSAEHAGAPYGFTDRGPTGATVRTLMALAEASGKAGQ